MREKPHMSTPYSVGLWKAGILATQFSKPPVNGYVKSTLSRTSSFPASVIVIPMGLPLCFLH
jgi:hypothetical protein